MANAKHILQGELNALLVWDLHTTNTSCLYPEGQAVSCDLHCAAKEIKNVISQQQYLQMEVVEEPGAEHSSPY